MSLRSGLALYIRLSDIFRCLSFAISVGESITLTALAKDLQRKDMGQHTSFWYLSHRRAAKAQASLRICADSPKPSLLSYTKQWSSWSRWSNIRPLAQFDTSKRAFKGILCAYAISIKISSGGSYRFSQNSSENLYLEGGCLIDDRCQ